MARSFVCVRSASSASGLVDERGFVRLTPDLRLPGHRNVFALVDVAATDPLRSSARNRADGSSPTMSVPSSTVDRCAASALRRGGGFRAFPLPGMVFPSRADAVDRSVAHLQGRARNPAAGVISG